MVKRDRLQKIQWKAMKESIKNSLSQKKKTKTKGKIMLIKSKLKGTGKF